MFQRVPDILPARLVEELIRLARINRNWVAVRPIDDGKSYQCTPRYDTWLKPAMSSGADAVGLWATSMWLIDGPKVFRPTVIQCRAMEQVEVRLNFEDYAQPYPALLVDLPEDGKYDPFLYVLAFKSENTLVFNLISRENLNDITTTISGWHTHCAIEESLQKFDRDCESTHESASRALRVAANSCLALTNHETATGFLFPQEVERDRRFAAEKTERGERAKERLPLHAMLVAFKQTVILHKTIGEATDEHDPTDREVNSHWRRGHWARQPYGPNHSLRKLILRPPVLVRADKFLGETADTTTLMKT